MTISLSTKLGELKSTFAHEFGHSSDARQRLFYMGRELKSGGRSLSKLGLGKSSNNVLHMHVLDANRKSSSTSTSGTKRRRTAAMNNGNNVAPRGGSNGHSDDGIIEIVDSDEEATKRRR